MCCSGKLQILPLCHGHVAWALVGCSASNQCFPVFVVVWSRESGLLSWRSGKEPAASAEDVGSILGSERSPGGGNGNPLQYSCLENLMDRKTWWVIVHGVTKSQTRNDWACTRVYLTSVSEGLVRILYILCSLGLTVNGTKFYRPTPMKLTFRRRQTIKAETKQHRYFDIHRIVQTSLKSVWEIFTTTKDLSSLAFVLSSPIPLNLRQQLSVCIFNLKNYSDGVSYLRWGEMAETNVGRDPLLNNFVCLLFVKY